MKNLVSVKYVTIKKGRRSEKTGLWKSTIAEALRAVLDKEGEQLLFHAFVARANENGDCFDGKRKYQETKEDQIDLISLMDELGVRYSNMWV